jgi:hypothetical protein
MEAQTFFIRSVLVQNVVMAVVMAIVVGLLIRFIKRRDTKYIVLVAFWGCVSFWFFNGPLWGFSAVTVKPQGLQLHYGFLSVFRNTTLPPDSPWKIKKHLGGIRKLKNLRYFSLPGHQSLKVRGEEKFEILKALGAAIDQLNGRPMGGIEERADNM